MDNQKGKTSAKRGLGAFSCVQHNCQYNVEKKKKIFRYSIVKMVWQGRQKDKRRLRLIRLPINVASHCKMIEREKKGLTRSWTASNGTINKVEKKNKN